MARRVRPQTPVATLLSAVGAFPAPLRGGLRGGPRAPFLWVAPPCAARHSALAAWATEAGGQFAVLCAARSPSLLPQGTPAFKPEGNATPPLCYTRYNKGEVCASICRNGAPRRCLWRGVCPTGCRNMHRGACGESSPAARTVRRKRSAVLPDDSSDLIVVSVNRRPLVSRGRDVWPITPPERTAPLPGRCKPPDQSGGC